MYTGINGGLDSNVVAMPEWKKSLILKKRAGDLAGSGVERSILCGPIFCRDYKEIDSGGYANGRSNIRKFVWENHKESNSGRAPEIDAIIPKKVTQTIGNVELRSLTPKLYSNCTDSNYSDGSKCNRSPSFSCSIVLDSDNEGCKELQYGPGIVHRLRARFLSIGAKMQCKHVVRRFSSLENLPSSQSGSYRPRSIRQDVKTSFYNHSYVKKAQSMETLFSSTPEQLVPKRRLNIEKGTNRQMTAKSAIPCEEENCPLSSPRICKSNKRWEYRRSVSASFIEESELPKPDTVKLVKKIFESPSVDQPMNCLRFWKSTKSASDKTVTSSKAAAWSSSILDNATTPYIPTRIQVGNNIQQITKVEETATCHGAKQDYLEYVEDPPPLWDSYLQSKEVFFHMPDLSLTNSVLHSIGTLTSDDNASCVIERELTEENDCGKSVNDTPKLLPFVQVIPEVDEKTDEKRILPSQVQGVDCDRQTAMVVVSSTGDVDLHKLWQGAVRKPPQTTSIVFDFRGKDVKPNITLHPTPFGCRSSKGPNASATQSTESAMDYLEVDDWDEINIGADLFEQGSIEFDGANVKAGRGALLEIRNKKGPRQAVNSANPALDNRRLRRSPQRTPIPGHRTKLQTFFSENGCIYHDPWNQTLECILSIFQLVTKVIFYRIETWARRQPSTIAMESIPSREMQ